MTAAQRPRPGEQWRTPDKRTIYVESVQGDQVSGYANPHALSDTMGVVPAGGSSQMTTYAGNVADFERYELVGPRWEVVFTAPALGEHPTQDPMLGALGAVAEVRNRRRPTVSAGAPQPALNQDEAGYEVIVVALTAEEAQQKLAEAAAPHGELTIHRTTKAL